MRVRRILDNRNFRVECKSHNSLPYVWLVWAQPAGESRKNRNKSTCWHQSFAQWQKCLKGQMCCKKENRADSFTTAKWIMYDLSVHPHSYQRRQRQTFVEGEENIKIQFIRWACYQLNVVGSCTLAFKVILTSSRFTKIHMLRWRFENSFVKHSCFWSIVDDLSSIRYCRINILSFMKQWGDF